MDHNYDEHYQLWLLINNLVDTPDNWYKFNDEEFYCYDGM